MKRGSGNPFAIRRYLKLCMKQPCDEAVIRAGTSAVPCADKSRRWVLVATILGSSMAFIDSTVVNVALPALQSSLHANVVDLQWVVESYGLFLSALILVGGALGDSFGRRAMFRISGTLRFLMCRGSGTPCHACPGKPDGEDLQDEGAHDDTRHTVRRRRDLA